MPGQGPPEWRAVVPLHRTVRLGVVANQPETDITVAQLARLQSFAISTTGVQILTYAIKIKRLDIWFCSPSAGTNISATVEWNAGSTGFLMDGVSVAATSSSTTEYAHLSTRPPVDSLASWYQATVTGLTNILFSMSAPAGAIVQVSYDWVPTWTEAGSGSVVTVSGAVAGTMYAVGWNTNILALPPLNSVV